MISSDELLRPNRLPPEFHQRIWGSVHLEPWFPNTPHNVGEVWFRQPDSPVLVKFIFATENLSIQVHPDDTLAQRYGFPQGKTEMWHILRAAPEAKIALGFNQVVTANQVRRAAGDGSIMELVRWIPVFPGQTWFIPAGAVHAIGAGVALCEVQQNSDLTYRLYDYGRGRELHLDQSIAAVDLSYRSAQPTLGLGVVVDCPFFQVTKAEIKRAGTSAPASLAIVLWGAGTLNGAPCRQGEVFATPSSQLLQFSGNASLLTVLTKTSTDPIQASTPSPG